MSNFECMFIVQPTTSIADVMNEFRQEKKGTNRVFPPIVCTRSLSEYGIVHGSKIELQQYSWMVYAPGHMAPSTTTTYVPMANSTATAYVHRTWSDVSNITSINGQELWSKSCYTTATTTTTTTTTVKSYLDRTYVLRLPQHSIMTYLQL